jgi:hypothetical protein
MSTDKPESSSYNYSHDIQLVASFFQCTLAAPFSGNYRITKNRKAIFRLLSSVLSGQILSVQANLQEMERTREHYWRAFPQHVSDQAALACDDPEALFSDSAARIGS